MSIAKQTFLYCDGGYECPMNGECLYSGSMDSATEQRKRASREGWVRRDGFDLCPECARRLKKQEPPR